MAFELAGKSGESCYNGRMTPFVVLSCLVAATGGVIFGYDLGISGGVTSMEPFLEKFFPKVYERMRDKSQISNYCKFDSQLLTAFTSSLYIAGLFASFFASSITDSFGRKVSMLIGGAAFFAGAALGGAAVNVYMLIFGRILLGFGVAFTNQVGEDPGMCSAMRHMRPTRCTCILEVMNGDWRGPTRPLPITREASLGYWD